MTYAIVESGGKQYRAAPGEVIEVDRLPQEVGESVDLKALLVADEGEIRVGTPYVEDVSVQASVVAQVKGPKVIVFKYHPKKRYRRKQGHRQKYTRLKIEAIKAEG